MDGGLDIALVQLRTPATADAGLAHAEPLIRQAASEGARLILTPEGTNLLEQRRDLRSAALSSEGEDAAVIGLRRLAAELGVWLLIGSAIVRSDRQGEDRAANRSLLVGPDGAILARYDKLHVFDVDLPNGETYRESAGVRPGDGAAVDAMRQLIGTVSYLAPELVTGEAADARADVYALSATLWQLFVGRSPFEVPGGKGTSHRSPCTAKRTSPSSPACTASRT